MYYPDRKEYIKEYITFLFSLLDEFTILISRGRPKIYSDASLLVFYVMMTLKQINAIRAQHRWLYTHPVMLETLRLIAVFSIAPNLGTQIQSVAATATDHRFC